ncbi:permease-like cell division protein FtsX [Nocardioides alcanivorans]|uniref:permease-like cell division protein FtsX n=1 Tax=Nocardioides alcanivorans TaxID=2897352 RepID=UPI001F259069|nr:permease-like cell division protein FtsX [Nocardioides alcanivorans]
MQLRHVFSELRQGLRRNLTMHIAVVLTLFVSLTLVGLGILLNSQAQKTEDYFGSKLQATIYLCNGARGEVGCVGAVSDAEKAAIVDAIEDNGHVKSWYEESQQVAFDRSKELMGDNFRISSPDAMHSSIWVTLKDPRDYDSVVSSVQTLPGVHSVFTAKKILDPIYSTINAFKYGSLAIGGFLILAALLLVANTIRLAAFARRREIGIMRLVGASSLYISLPFLLEALVTAVIGVALAAGALGAFMRFGVHDRLSDSLRFMPWVDSADYLGAVGWLAIIGPLLTVLPTLVLTRKYLKV